VLRLASATDAFASTGVRDRSGVAGRDAGHQIDARIRAWVVPGFARLDLGVSHLIAGRFFDDAPNGTHAGDTTYFYADVTYTVSRRNRLHAGQ
jgi:hypothetical protein